MSYRWECITENAEFSERDGAGALVFKNKRWLLGGQTATNLNNPANCENFYNDVWCSSDGIKWEKVLGKAPWESRGMIGGNAITEDKIFLLGGGTYDTKSKTFRRYYNDVWTSENGTEWTCVCDNAPWHPRQYHEVAYFDKKLWVMEGWDGISNRNDVW